MAETTGLKVSYLRCSTEYGHLELQRQTLAPLLAKEEGKVIELSETHSGRFMDGPQLRYLRDLIRSARVAKLFVYSWDRLGRNLREGCALVEECLANGTEVISYLEPYDLTKPEGLNMFHNTMASAQLFLSRLSINTARGLALAKQRGTFKGGTPKGEWWMAAKTKAKLPRILNLLKSNRSPVVE